MINKFKAAVASHRPAAVANAGILVGGFLGAFGGLFGALVGALLGFMVDRVRAALRPETPESRRDEAATVAETPNPRAVLGLGPEAGSAEIRRAWRRISKSCHPDTGARDEESARRFREAREAYEILIGAKAKRPTA